TTSAPTTSVPSTAAPTTSAPSTSAPSTQTPTTFNPSTLTPTTLVPATDTPTTYIQTTSTPSTLAPTTLTPTTSTPSTQIPTTFTPSTSAPSTQAPTTFNPSTLTLTTLVPATDTPTTYIQTTSTPSTSGPSTQTPTTSAPSTTSPITLAPSTIILTTYEPMPPIPTTLIPTTLMPTIANQTTASPTTNVPKTQAPITPIPKSTSISKTLTHEMTLTNANHMTDTMTSTKTLDLTLTDTSTISISQSMTQTATLTETLHERQTDTISETETETLTKTQTETLTPTKPTRSHPVTYCGDNILQDKEFCDQGKLNGKGPGYCLKDCSGFQPVPVPPKKDWWTKENTMYVFAGAAVVFAAFCTFVGVLTYKYVCAKGIVCSKPESKQTQSDATVVNIRQSASSNYMRVLHEFPEQNFQQNPLDVAVINIKPLETPAEFQVLDAASEHQHKRIHGQVPREKHRTPPPIDTIDIKTETQDDARLRRSSRIPDTLVSSEEITVVHPHVSKRPQTSDLVRSSAATEVSERPETRNPFVAPSRRQEAPEVRRKIDPLDLEKVPVYRVIPTLEEGGSDSD
ncbi:MAG: hypothetical protein WCK49_00960, partial [Myxococcaceae bacterium]